MYRFRPQLCASLTFPFLLFLFRSHREWVEEEWKSRRNWWPAFHFSFFWAKSDWKADAELACEKAFVAGILLGKGGLFSVYLDVAFGQLRLESGPSFTCPWDAQGF